MEMETQTLSPAISDVINSLKSSFNNCDITGAEQILLSWSQSVKLEVSSSFTDELVLLEVDKIELQVEISHLKKEIGFLREENLGLKEKVSNLSEIMELGESETKISRLEKEMDFLKRENLNLRETVSNLSQIGEKREHESVLEIEKNTFVTGTPAKKLKRRVDFSDSESDSDDNKPIGKVFNVKEANLAEEKVQFQKRRLVRSREMETPVEDVNSLEDSVSGKMNSEKTRRKLRFSDSDDETLSSGSQVKGTTSPVKKYVNLDKSDSEEDSDEPESEGESLDGFIVTGSEPESTNSTQNPSGSTNLSSNPNSQLDTDMDNDTLLVDALNKIKRKKKRSENKWEYEADMLAEFGQKPETCLKAVCALYQRQTEEEQSAKATFVLNNIGFSQFDAERGSLIAEFLMGGRSWGPVVRTVEELQEFEKYGIEFCEHIAMKYSKQLFEIYRVNEDPYFGPSLSG